VRILHRQIFRELVTLFSLCMGCLLGLLLFGKLLSFREIFFSRDLGLVHILLLFVYLTPSLLLLLTPIGCMLSVFLTFLRMSTDNELVALKASGIGLRQMIAAPLIFCVLCTLLNFFVSFYGLAWGMERLKDTVLEFMHSGTKMAMHPGVFNQEFPRLTFYSHKVDKKSGELRFVFVEDETLKDATVTIVAPKASIVSDPDAMQMRVGFKNGRIYRREGDKLDVLHFGSYTIKVPMNWFAGLDLVQTKPSKMSYWQLIDLDGNPNAPENYDRVFVNKVKVELVKRISLPVACFLLGLFALPIACLFQGLKRQYGLVLSLGLFLVYYVLFSFGVTLGEAGRLAPLVGLWTPNLLYLAVGVSVFRLAEREKTPQLVAWLANLRLRRAA
jgi:lipopolysaccharide export system permease protein